MECPKSIRRAFLLLLVLLMGGMLALQGCAGRAPETPPAPQDQQAKPGPEQPPGQEQPAADSVVTLYFGDRQAMHVIPEEREVTPEKKPLGQVLVEELIKGPDDPFLVLTMPEGTRVLSFSVSSGVARVDLSREFRDNHVGGTAGEGMTINSLAFTLTELPDIEQVQILIEGKEGDTLGHVVFDKPFTRGPIRIHDVFLDRERQAWLQGLVDAGRDEWRRVPLEAARREGRLAGFQLSDEFRLLGMKGKGGAPLNGSGERTALVEVVRGGKHYVITLTQPIRVGDRGVWAVTAVAEKAAALKGTGNIVVSRPEPGEEIASPVTIKGRATVFEGRFTIEVQDGKKLLASKLMTVNPAPEGDEFEVSLEFELPTGDFGAIVFTTESAKTGETIEELIVPVKFRR